ncbi:MAG: hypothetical protein H5T61_04945 [Thermoflexales bacterium]|nr:hypothetical protein [Thermoflexales bacterium]
MSGNPFFDAFCGMVLLIGIVAALFCLILALVNSRERGAAGLFVLSALFCCFLVVLISSLVF